MEDLIKKFEEKREAQNYLDKILPPKEREKPPPVGGGAGGGGSGVKSHAAHQAGGLIENPACKICKWLKTEQRTSSHAFFKNHSGLNPPGCPNFISFSLKERRETLRRCKICIGCLDPKVILDKRTS